jgi:hypothetical protein
LSSSSAQDSDVAAIPIAPRVGVKAWEGGLLAVELELGMSGEEVLDSLVVFLWPNAARAVDEQAAGGEVGGAVFEDLVLEFDQ